MPPLVPISLAFAIGILCAPAVTAWSWVVAAVGVVAGCFLSIERRHRWVGVVALLLLWWSVGVLRVIVADHHPCAAAAAWMPTQPLGVAVRGIVVADPVELFSPNEPERQVAVVETTHWRLTEGWRSRQARLRVQLQEPRVHLAYGDEVALEGRLSAVPTTGNPGQYDWRAALARARIYGLMTVRPFEGVAHLSTGHGSLLFRAVSALRRRWETCIQRVFSDEQAGLLRSLILGERVRLDEELKHAFIETGTVQSLARECTKLC